MRTHIERLHGLADLRSDPVDVVHVALEEEDACVLRGVDRVRHGTKDTAGNPRKPPRSSHGVGGQMRQ